MLLLPRLVNSTTTTSSLMGPKSTRPDLERWKNDESRPETYQPRLRRNAVVPFHLGFQSDDEGDEIRVSHSRAVSNAGEAAAEASVSAEEEQNPNGDKKQVQSIDKRDDEDNNKKTVHYIRVGRRTVEDESGDIPTQFVVVAKMDAKGKITWLSVATWQLNGLRIGTLDTGDRIREDDEVFSYSIGLNSDPFFVARNSDSTRGIRDVLVERSERGEVGVQEETLDDESAQKERREAQESRMLEDYGPKVIYGGKKAVRAIAARQNAKLRFPHPWALPTALTRSGTCFPTGLVGFSSVSSDVAITSINVVATFANEIDGGRDLRLKHFMQVAFEPDETLDSAKRYFRQGDEGAEFRGLENNGYLARKWWLLELWVLPHFRRCSVLYKWDDGPELTARAFCDAETLNGEGDVEPKLYVEVRIVQDPDHLGGESEDDFVSEEDD